jgi:hypothetical protein
MRKITYFPPTYQEELFYGTIGRFQFIDNISTAALTKRLFNKDKYIIQMDHLGCLKTFCNNIGNIITPEEILEKHSLIDIYLPFLETNQKYVLDMITSGDETFAGQIIRPRRPRGQIMYCPHCVQEDVSNYGETYIHREHQIPNIVACYKHGLKLLPYLKEPDYQNSFQRINYKKTNKSSIELSEVHFDLARSAVTFLEYNTRGYSLKDFQSRYRELFKNEGFINTTQIFREDFADEFINHFGVEFLELFMENSIQKIHSKNEISAELHRIFFGSKIELMNHILLLDFLNISVEQFFQIEIKTENEIPKTPPILIADSKKSEDELILEKLKAVFWQVDIDNKYKAITFDMMFRSIKINDWQDKINIWPISLEYLKSICRTSEAGLLRQCKDIADRYLEKDNKVANTLDVIRGKCKLYNEERIEQFETIKDSILDYIKEKQGN